MADLPVLISFFAGGPEYAEAAQRLRADCERLDMPHDIEELEVGPDEDWARICRLKVPFYLRKLEEHRRAVLWVDVDSRLRRLPEMLRGCEFDLAGYAQHFRYIRDFDPYDTVRFWIPAVLFFGRTPRATRFLRHMQEIDHSTTDRVTDDYVLHEAWSTFDEPLNVGFISPISVTRNQRPSEDTCVVIGDSGQASDFRKLVRQHQGRDLLSNPRVAKRVMALHDNPRVRSHVLRSVAEDVLKGDRGTVAELLRHAVAADPDDLALVRRYAEALRRAGRGKEAREAVREFLERRPDTGEALLTMVKLALAGHDLEVARDYVALLRGHADPRWRQQGDSLAFDLELEERATDRRISLSERAPLWWMKTPYPGNFGDILSPYIVEKVTGKPPRFVPRNAGLLAIGSIVKFATERSHVWGSGTARAGEQLSSGAVYHAVRGPLTRKVVLQSGGKCPPVYGDPGLLLPRFYSPRVSKKHRLGLVRHISHESFNRLGEGVRPISARRVGEDGVERFVDEILECEAILTTSLHGLIVAHAYGVPARWCTFSEPGGALAGDGIKFEDYFKSVGMRKRRPLDLSEYEVIDESLARRVDKTVDLAFDPERLMEVFPDSF